MGKRIAVLAASLLAGLLPGAPAVADPGPAIPTAVQVTEVRLTGVARLNAADLLAELKTRPGQPFDAAALDGDIETIETRYRERGYPLAHITPGYGVDASGVVTIPVDEGRIEEIRIEGATKTRQYVIRRQLDARPGGVYDTRALAADRQRLFDLGLFESVSTAPGVGSDPGKSILTINVKERHTGDVMAAFGYTSTAGLVGYAQVGDRNFLGTGNTLALNWQRGTYLAALPLTTDGTSQTEARARSGYDLTWHMPSLLRRDLSAGLRAYDAAAQGFYYLSQDIDSRNVKGYEWRSGHLATLAKRLGGGFSLGLVGRSDSVNYDVAPVDAVAPVGESLDPTKITSVRLSLARGPVTPFQAQQSMPSAGVFLELGRGSALGESQTYAKYGATVVRYVPLGGKQTLATRLQVGWSSGEVPFSELFSAGGPQTVRSYYWHSFLGTRLLALNTEFRREIKQGLTGALFLDLGYAWPRNSALNPGDLRPAVGLGLKVITPFGPFRLDYAIGKDGGRAHLTTGDTF